MVRSHEIAIGSPEQDPSVIEMLANGLYEVPNLAGKGIPMLDTSQREIDPDVELLVKVSQANGPLHLPFG